MNNILRKTAGVMIATSMLCALFTVGCSSADKSNNNTSAKETTTEATTEQVTEAPTIKLLDEPVVIEEDSIQKATNVGITVEGRNINYSYIQTKRLSASDVKYDMKDKSTKEVFNISMKYHVNNIDENGREEHSATQLAEIVKVSIPYDEGMYVVRSEDGIAYDVNAKYIDGKYVFETDKLGTFMMRTEAVGRTTPEKTKNLKLSQQTLVDEATGIQVSGMLPDGAEVEAEIHYIDNNDFYDRFEFSYNVESDYPRISDLSDYYTVFAYEKGASNIAGTISEEGWADKEGTAGGKLSVSINVVKDLEILDFDSDLTVTLPFDYHNGLAIGSAKTELGMAKAVHYDYDTKEFTTLEIIPKENTAKDTFEFKAKSIGLFFLGSEGEIDKLVDYYTD